MLTIERVREILSKNNLFVDFDGVIVQTTKAICDCYHEDFQYYKKFTPIDWRSINTWDFKELECATSEYINTYFNQQRFFDKLEFIPYAKETLEELNKDYNITIVSSGYSPNLKAKLLWIEKNLPFCGFIGVNMKEYRDKSHVEEMRTGIFIDDSSSNLKISNALVNICFGEKYSWNEDWEGIRLDNWKAVHAFINRLKGEVINS